MKLPRWLKLLLFVLLSHPFAPRANSHSRQIRRASSLSGLLDALEEIAEMHHEIFDTDVREHLWQAVEHRYVRLDRQYTMPFDLGMFSQADNGKVHAALERHLGNLVAAAKAFTLDTEAKRMHTITNPTVKSQRAGYTFEDFFGAR